MLQVIYIYVDFFSFNSPQKSPHFLQQFANFRLIDLTTSTSEPQLMMCPSHVPLPISAEFFPIKEKLHLFQPEFSPPTQILRRLSTRPVVFTKTCLHVFITNFTPDTRLRRTAVALRNERRPVILHEPFE